MAFLLGIVHLVFSSHPKDLGPACWTPLSVRSARWSATSRAQPVTPWIPLARRSSATMWFLSVVCSAFGLVVICLLFVTSYSGFFNTSEPTLFSFLPFAEKRGGIVSALLLIFLYDRLEEFCGKGDWRQPSPSPQHMSDIRRFWWVWDFRIF